MKLDSHNISICNDKTINMVQLLPAEPNEANVFETFARLSTSDSQTNIDQLSNGQPITNSHNNYECNSSSNNILLPDNQCNIILHLFSIMAEELQNFSKQDLSNITKMTQAHHTTQEYTGKLTENAISQALSKTQGTTAPSPITVGTSIQNINYTSPPYDSNQTSNWPTSLPTMSHTSHVDTDPTYGHQET